MSTAVLMPSRTCMVVTSSAGLDLRSWHHPGRAARVEGCAPARRLFSDLWPAETTAPDGGPGRCGRTVAAGRGWLDLPVPVTLLWVPLVLLLDRGADIWWQRALGLRHLAAPAGAAAARDAAGPGPGRRGRRLRDRRRVHVLAAAAACTSTGWATCRPSCRRATAWSTCARWRSAARPGCAAAHRPLVTADRPGRWACAPRGGCWSRTGRDVLGAFWYLCLVGFLLVCGPVPHALRRRVRRGHLPRAARHLAGHLGLGDPRPDRAGRIGNPPSGAAGGYGWFDLAAVLAGPVVLGLVLRLRGVRRPGRRAAETPMVEDEV